MKKKLLSMIVLISTVFSMPALNAGAQATTPKSLLVFGDSISTGYGLPDKSKSFGSLLAQKLDISGSYVNLAADGATSSDVLSEVQNHTKEIAAADTILLTAGGNDFLNVLFSNIKTALGLSSDATDGQIQQALSSDSNAAALIAARLQKTGVQAQFASAETGFAKNLSSIVTAIKTANSNAKLYIQTIYNPFDAVPGYESLSSIVETVLSTINAAIRNGASGNYTVIDTYTAFQGKALLLTNIAKLDIHPNEAGHEAIYELACAAVTGREENAPTITGTLANGKLTISVTGLSSDIVQVNFLAVNTADKSDYLMDTATVSGNSSSTTFAVKGTDYKISATTVNSKLAETALTPIEVRSVESVSAGVTYSSHVQKVGWQSFVNDGALSGTTGKLLRDEAVRIKLSGTLPAGASIIYQAHVQKQGWLKAVSDGEAAGTTGKSLRLEALRITLSGMTGYEVQYRVFVQHTGWADWKTTKNGTDIFKAGVAGTTGKSLMVEAIEVRIVKAGS
jgi:Bacterial surface proteins containing Ig-like domains